MIYPILQYKKDFLLFFVWRKEVNEKLISNILSQK